MPLNKYNTDCAKCAGPTQSLAGTGAARYCPKCEGSGKTVKQWEKEISDAMFGIKQPDKQQNPPDGSDVDFQILDLDEPDPEKTVPYSPNPIKFYAPCQQTYLTIDTNTDTIIPCPGCHNCLYKKSLWLPTWDSFCRGGWIENTSKGHFMRCWGCSSSQCPTSHKKAFCTQKYLFDDSLAFGILNTTFCDGNKKFTSTNGIKVPAKKSHTCLACKP